MNQIIHSLYVKWDLSLDGDKLETPSSYIHYVKHNQIPAILKIFKENSDETHAADILNYYAGNGAVQIINFSNEAILLERIVPGYDLTILNNNDLETKIFCQILNKLHSKPLVNSSLKHISSLIIGFDIYIKAENKEFSIEEIMEAKDIFTILCSEQHNQVLLHGDLHHYNILQGELGWLAIDPKGYVGPPEFDVGAFLRNPIFQPELYSTEKIINERVNIIAEKLGFDKGKILKWTYVQTILAISYGVQEKKYLDGWKKLAVILRKLF